MDHQQWLSIAEAATLLKVGEPTVQQLIDQGTLQAEQHGDTMRVSEAALLAFLRANQQTLETGQQPPEVAALPPTDTRPHGS